MLCKCDLKHYQRVVCENNGYKLVTILAGFQNFRKILMFYYRKPLKDETAKIIRGDFNIDELPHSNRSDSF